MRDLVWRIGRFIKIRLISKNEMASIFGHLGAGTIAARCFVPDLEVELGRGLKDYELSDPKSADAREIIRTSLKLLKMTPDPVNWPLLGATYRSALAESPHPILFGYWHANTSTHSRYKIQI